MSAASIQAKIKRGLAKAVNKTGSAANDSVYLIKTTTVGGSPLGGGTTTSASTLLPNAIFKSFLVFFIILARICINVSFI